MKRVILTLSLSLLSFSLFAKGWAVGGRVTAGVEAQVEYEFASKNYIEGRLGVGFMDGASLDFTALYQWNVLNMDWTPTAGEWFFDAGTGISLGAQSNMYIGATGCAKLGIKFKAAPVKLALDYSPSFGSWLGKGNDGFRTDGLFNLGISCVYCF